MWGLTFSLLATTLIYSKFRKLSSPKMKKFQKNLRGKNFRKAGVNVDGKEIVKAIENELFLKDISKAEFESPLEHQ